MSEPWTVRRRFGAATILLSILAVIATPPVLGVIATRGTGGAITKFWLGAIFIPFVFLATAGIMLLATERSRRDAVRSIPLLLSPLGFASVSFVAQLVLSDDTILWAWLAWVSAPVVWFVILIRAIGRIRDPHFLSGARDDPRAAAQRLWRSGEISDDEYDLRLRRLDER